MEQNEQKKVLHWVRGNTLPLAIPLEKEIITEEQTTREDYIVQSDDVVTVNLVSSSRRYIYAPKSIEGNVVSIEDNGELDLGTYGVEVLISKANGKRLRSFWNYLIKIHNTNDVVLEEWDDFADVNGEILDSAIFFFAKGDPFTYEDFTEEQLDDIKRPALEAANVATQAAQNANDAATNANNAKNAAIIATNLANSATQNANDAASSANVAAISANQAKRNADTATINANNATEDALQATSDAITATTDAKRATDKTEEAIEQAQRAAVIGSNPDFIGSDYYVYKYNARLGRYERSNIYVRGENGDKGEKGDKGDKGDAGTTDYNLLENKPTRVSQFENDADYATESFVNSSIATATATYRGSYNLVTDLGLSVGVSAADVSAALATSISDADNNDYCFVQIPVATDTPTVIARIDRYKHNGSGWLYEYTLNNSGFTAEQWDAINSGITSGDVDKLDALPTSAQLTSLLNGKQDTINDLASIRSGASAGATAYQKPDTGIPESDLSQGVKDKMNEKEVSNNKVSSWQATPDNSHYPSEKLVKDSLDAKAGIGDVLFANFSNLTPKKTFEYDVSDTAYHPLFSRANTGISQLMSEVDDIVKFRITVTGTNIYARVDVVVRFQPALTAPCIMAWNENYNSSGNYTGISYIRSVYPKAINSGYNWIVEIAASNNSTRHVKVEVFEDTENVTWVETEENSSFYSPTQNNNALSIGNYRGLCANSNWTFPNSIIGTAGIAGYLSGYLNTWIGGSSPLAGEAVAANFLCIISGQRMYRATNKNVPIDCDCGVFCVGGATGANSALTFSNIKQKTHWNALTADPALTMDTFDRGDQVYLRCTLGQDGKIYPDGHLSNVKSAGYTWVHIGTAASATAINLDTCGKPFITLNNDGKVTHINGTAVMDSSMSKWGVVSQTQTWTQASDGGYDYTMSNLQYGWIPQANIDLYESLGATFNANTGYFEMNGLEDLSYEEMKTAYRMSYCTNGIWSYLPNDLSFRTNFPLSDGFNYLGGSQVMNRKIGFTIYYLYNPINLYVIRLTVNTNYALSLTGESGYIFYTANPKIKEVQGILNVYSASALSGYFFRSAPNLETIKIDELRSNLNISKSPRLSAESIAFAINRNAAGTTAITITLHPTAYARAIADSDVQAALQAHTNVSLASA